MVQVKFWADAKPMSTLLTENYNIKCRPLPPGEMWTQRVCCQFWFQHLGLRLYVAAPAVKDVVSRPSSCFLLSSQVTRSWGTKFRAIFSGWNSRSNTHWDLWVPVLFTFRVLKNLWLLDTYDANFYPGIWKVFWLRGRPRIYFFQWNDGSWESWSFSEVLPCLLTIDLLEKWALSRTSWKAEHEKIQWSYMKQYLTKIIWKMT